MNNIFRGLIAGYGAKKLGGGCFGTIIVFILIWVALGQCSGMSREKPAPEAVPTRVQAMSPDVLLLLNDGAWHQAASYAA